MGVRCIHPPGGMSIDPIMFLLTLPLSSSYYVCTVPVVIVGLSVATRDRAYNPVNRKLVTSCAAVLSYGYGNIWGMCVRGYEKV